MSRDDIELGKEIQRLTYIILDLENSNRKLQLATRLSASLSILFGVLSAYTYYSMVEWANLVASLFS